MTSALTQTLTQANFLGQGFDISGAYHIPGELLRPLLDPDKVGTRSFEFLGQEYTIPDYVTGIVDTEGKYLIDTVETREEVQRSFSAKAGVHVSAGGFSGQMEAAYSHTFTRSSEYAYSFTNLYQRLALLRLDLNRAVKALSKGFIDAYRSLPGEVTPATLPAFAAFFHDFGFYFVAELALGGTLEYYVAVNKISTLSTSSIAVQVKAEYNAVFYAGEVSGEIKQSEEFKKYVSSRSVNIAARGGDPALLARLISIDPGLPSSETVEAYERWLDSIRTAPGVADFQLLGVWELIPEDDRRKLVQDAFVKLLPTLHPRMTAIVPALPGAVPTIVLGRPLTPDEPPSRPNGFQMLVLDREKIGPDGVIYDRYYETEDSSVAAYQAMYDRIAADLVGFDFTGTGQVLVLASFGLSVDRAPTAKLAALLRAAGAGDMLSMWMERSQPSRDPAASPLSYLLVGIPGMGPHTGVERLDAGKKPLSQEVLFYWQRDVRRYTFSAGSPVLAEADPTAAA
ncbi:MAC/perforin domain-containing protein [Nannocystis pusilla]|uniref:MAC/perforin domain-containing protein n=1 Tax=Nannocystis pusilla TaxID=889268 RepID=UPI003DA4F03D